MEEMETTLAARAAQEYLAHCRKSLQTEETQAAKRNSCLESPTSRCGGASDLLSDELLVRSLSALPANYDFEVAKTVERIRRERYKCIALQLPEGLQMYACTLVDVLSRLCRTESNPAGCSFVVLVDVTYGACCVDDLAAWRYGCDFLVHYGHSCLVPVQSSHLKTMYVFVRVAFNTEHLLACIRKQFQGQSELVHLMLLSTIQFQSCLASTAKSLRELGLFREVSVPQARPLSRGELLGCTAPRLPSPRHQAKTQPLASDHTAVVYIGDGRFHLESAMIHNPHVDEFYRYDPYAKLLTKESYDHSSMMNERWEAIAFARQAQVRFWAVILGTLGRQGSPVILRRLLGQLREAHKEYIVILCSEITPEKLRLFSSSGIQVWVQIACPRLSIDWGRNFAPDGAPVLTPYEAMVALGRVPWRAKRYPMDYYSNQGGPWSNYFVDEEKKAVLSTNPRD
jgi:2-(3-amino-3-carboxypropyl)histidine synthase